jgi:hypothetical protein
MGWEGKARKGSRGKAQGARERWSTLRMSPVEDVERAAWESGNAACASERAQGTTLAGRFGHLAIGGELQ